MVKLTKTKKRIIEDGQNNAQKKTLLKLHNTIHNAKYELNIS